MDMGKNGLSRRSVFLFRDKYFFIENYYRKMLIIYQNKETKLIENRTKQQKFEPNFVKSVKKTINL